MYYTLLAESFHPLHGESLLLEHMRIAQVAPLTERVPPKTYGGTERVVFALTEELVARGHDVTLFATGDSITSAKLASVYPRSLREAHIGDLGTRNHWTLLNIGAAYGQQEEFDIIHDHNGVISLPTANIAATPVVMTLHGIFTQWNKPLFASLRKPHLVTISKSQGLSVPGLNYIGNVYNGLDMSTYPFSSTHDGYLLFVGRITQEKGVHIAIEIAKKLSLPLIIAAKLDGAAAKYFQQHIKPHLGKTIRWIGEVSDHERNKLMSRALCFLHPVTWPEPFGLTLIEAMACGCPVVAIGKGSVPEIVVHGETGFVAKSEDQIASYVLDIDRIDRSYCRYYARTHFSGEGMADGYEAVYREVLKKEYQEYPTEPLFA